MRGIPTPRRLRRDSRAFRRTVVGATITAVAISAGMFAARSGHGQAAVPEKPAPATTRIARRDLVSRAQIHGTLGYDDHRALVGRLPGTLTWLPGVGQRVRRGQALYRVDGQPVNLFYGATPAWRTLALGVADGADVQELEANLVALGYDPERVLTVDEHFSIATRDAVRRWQKGIGVGQSGEVELGQVVFAPGERRVARVGAPLGGSALGPVIDTSATSQVVGATIDAAEQTLVRVKDRLRVVLPDRTVVRGFVRQVSRAAQPDQAASSGAVVPLTIALEPNQTLPALDQAPVTVEIVAGRKRSAVSVPVVALVALPGGGYSVEVVTDSQRRRFARVRLGTFADGYVEVHGAGIRPGLRVVVPS